MPNPALGNLEADITEARTVVKGATILVEGFQERLDKAVEAAIANGATAEQLQPLSDLSDGLEADVKVLAAAVQKNTGAPA